MARSKRKPGKGRLALPASEVTTRPAPWDYGATGPANRIGLVVEDAPDTDDSGREVNPNGRKRARRVDMLEVWHRKGMISTAGFNIAEKLRDAFEATQRTPGWPDNDRVQSSPKPDHAVTIQIDRIAAYERIMRHVSRFDRPIISACVLDRQTPAAIRNRDGKRPFIADGYKIGIIALRDALDRLATAMGG